MGLPELEVRCWKCWGEGMLAMENHGEMTECPECGGLGWVPTDEGRKLLEFLQRHLVLEAEGEEEE